MPSRGISAGSDPRHEERPRFPNVHLRLAMTCGTKKAVSFAICGVVESRSSAPVSENPFVTCRAFAFIGS